MLAGPLQPAVQAPVRGQVRHERTQEKRPGQAATKPGKGATQGSGEDRTTEVSTQTAKKCVF